MILGDGTHVSIGNEVIEFLGTEVHGNPEAVELGCCMGAAVYGPDRCTCWTEVYDRPQAEPRTDLHPGVQTKMCGDCACRPDSPERNDDQRYGHAGDMEEILAGDRPFWCHEGMRALAGYRHPDGTVVTLDEINQVAASLERTGPPFPLAADDYKPPIVDGVPYQADGTPGLVCGGWAAHRLARGGALPEGVVADAG